MGLSPNLTIRSFDYKVTIMGLSPNRTICTVAYKATIMGLSPNITLLSVLAPSRKLMPQDIAIFWRPQVSSTQLDTGQGSLTIYLKQINGVRMSLENSD